MFVELVHFWTCEEIYSYICMLVIILRHLVLSYLLLCICSCCQAEQCYCTKKAVEEQLQTRTQPYCWWAKTRGEQTAKAFCCPVFRRQWR